MLNNQPDWLIQQLLTIKQYEERYRYHSARKERNKADVYRHAIDHYHRVIRVWMETGEMIA